MPNSPTPLTHSVAQRPDWMRELAVASLEDFQMISAMVKSWPNYQILAGPELGSIMIHGRIAGNGSPFPVGECSITRCMVEDAQGHTGYSWILGQETERALWAARWDALLQDSAHFQDLWNQAIQPLQQKRIRNEQAVADKMQSTQVQFFSMENMRA
ncbi:phosphonate C-P lyase system protein PhnG [Acidithiobacillus sp. HP-6]|uniref:phosphonate C-P lyase system protein PhnG n=1 Tax=unclassified Acidithiobacillus TaxID=2614800 RepID=UPI001879D68D|nr:MULTISPECIES: phosphonate C-P lyase system protein PhnG [unclassified Acidithiobacillus]MBE7561468.1 phosphonate C-P lyase system protein PhnG [Acidithiobacillus sp. HP-6]MBE7570030.1 phosphonate C-P lyase system protein PhnG [Acidithiobacillus sp. HP-2]